MHSFFWYSSLLITDSSKVGSCRQTSTLAEPGAKACDSERHFSYSYITPFVKYHFVIPLAIKPRCSVLHRRAFFSSASEF